MPLDPRFQALLEQATAQAQSAPREPMALLKALRENQALSHEEELSHPYAAPLLATDLRGLPPALVITAECDPVRDGGEQYGQRLLEAGVPATVSRYDSMVHGFMHMGTLVPQQTKQAFDEASHALRTAFASAKNKR